jgi:leucyl aminopeptidase
MWDMKYDMAGSATVVGTIKALALRKASVNAVGIIGLVENMPSGSAQRPSDVVKTMSGKTIEVLNTDAEGRLVLADALHYAQVTFNPKCVIDIATLTGAIVVALGSTYAGCYASDTKLAQQLIEAGRKVDEKLWHMPLHSDYDKMLSSDIADMANISSSTHGAGSPVAANFLAKFIKKDVLWAHLDIAGVAWNKKGSSIVPKGAVGYGVRLLNKFIEDNYEE